MSFFPRILYFCLSHDADPAARTRRALPHYEADPTLPAVGDTSYIYSERPVA